MSLAEIKNAVTELSKEEFAELLAFMENAEDVAAYDAAKKANRGESSVPWEQVKAEMNALRRLSSSLKSSLVSS